MKKILIIIAAISLIGCGARHVNKSSEHLKQDVVEQTKDSMVIQSHQIEEKVDTTSTSEQVFEPIDSTKAMIIDIKTGTYKNARITNKKVKNGISLSKKENTSIQGSKITNKSIRTEIDANIKQIDKEPSFSFWWILIIAAAILLWFEYNKK